MALAVTPACRMALRRRSAGSRPLSREGVSRVRVTPSCGQRRPRWPSTAPHAQGNEETFAEENVGDMDSAVEQFMRQQAAIESGEDDQPTSINYTGKDVVPNDMLEAYSAEVKGVLKRLSKERDMTLNEIKLIVAIEDPRTKEQRVKFGIEEEAGVTREEMSQCLVDLTEGRQATLNRLALKALRDELVEWPNLNPPSSASGSVGEEEQYSERLEDMAEPARQPEIGRGGQPKERPEGLPDFLPDWMGYGLLYALSIVPVLITIGAVAILWTNSFS